jgi:preprotein translocase subunit SecG
MPSRKSSITTDRSTVNRKWTIFVSICQRLFALDHQLRIAVLITYVLYGLFILACIVLVVAVLLQPGKADAGALFASSVSSTAFGPRGTQTLLAKITIGAAACFMLIALMLSLPAIAGKRSVLQGAPAEPVPTPQQQASPAATAAPASDSGASPAQNTGAAQNANTNANSNAPAPATTAQPANSPQGKASPAQQNNKKP